MTSPHLPTSPKRGFRIRPFHVTLAVVLLIHAAAFALIFRDGLPGGSAASPSSAHKGSENANVTWQRVDSLVSESGRPAAGTAVATPQSLPGPDLSVAPPLEIPGLPEETQTAVGNEGMTGNPLLAESESPTGTPETPMPVRAATVVEDSAGIGPGAPAPGQGRGFGEGDNAGFDFGAFDLLITKAFHEAWEQPLGVDTPLQNNVAKLAVTIGRDGKVERFSLAHLTGVPELDSSVLAAARSVRSIAPLPETYHGESYDVTINFQLD